MDRSSQLNSCLYECQVTHARLSPKKHRFKYGMFYFCLDLGEITELCASSFLIRQNAPAIYSFCDRDFLDETTLGLREKVLRFIKVSQPQIIPKIARIQLLTNLRIVGYIFNPVSIYYCVGENGELVCAIAEVTNTFREAKLYFLENAQKLNISDTSQSAQDSQTSKTSQTSRASQASQISSQLPNSVTNAIKCRLPKLFYVSPFSELDTFFDFIVDAPASDLRLVINTVLNDQVTLASTVTGRRIELTTSTLLWLTLRYPLMSLRVITLIHWQALKLFLKGVPFITKEANPNLQTEVRRSHKTLGEGNASKPQPNVPFRGRSRETLK